MKINGMIAVSSLEYNPGGGMQGRTGLSGIRAMPEAPLEKYEFGAPKFPKRRPSFWPKIDFYHLISTSRFAKRKRCDMWIMCMYNTRLGAMTKYITY